MARSRFSLSVLALAGLLAGSLYAESITPLGKKMGSMAFDLAIIQKRITDPTKNAFVLRYVGSLKKSCQEAKALVPAKVASNPADKTEFEAAFDRLVDDLTKVEDALKENKNAVASDFFEKVLDEMKRGHEKFRPPTKKP